jgi:hypothetical protein
MAFAPSYPEWSAGYSHVVLGMVRWGALVLPHGARRASAGWRLTHTLRVIVRVRSCVCVIVLVRVDVRSCVRARVSVRGFAR